ncbi:hypothetical protein [Actinomadura parmotrematis]|uniref:Uncharacterized protein n=1 Tax=Actinomadura parmotrematis TaxID=2864039 RepID=A0ABS7FPC7_9ACTN|nr:hypothetical protein [Actinomadura parmotrematis]MBW8482253.1 hypothetical protein [Actinomadura parmotrematis]
MITMVRGLLRGAAAGATGTTALNVSTYADMALRGRPASGTPVAVVSRLADSAGVDVPGRGPLWDNRLEGLGGVGGGVTGVCVGAAAGLLRAAGIRLPAVVGGPLLGAAAMVAADLPMSRLGVSDPRTWSRADWAADAIPHLAYGMAAHATLAALFRWDEEAEAAAAGEPSRRSALLRGAALGAASGCRSSAGLTALALRSRRTDAGLAGYLAHPAAKPVAVLLASAELGVDKQPGVPSRLAPQGLSPRLALAAVTGGAAARRDGVPGTAPALAAALAAAAAAVAGHRLRAVAAQRFGSDLPGALAEDAVAAALAWTGARPAAR